MTAIGDRDIEAAVLGTLLLQPSNLFFATQLSVNDFCVQEHRMVFESIRMAMDAGQSPSAATLAPAFREMNFGGITGAQYLGRLITVAITQHVMPEYIRSLKDFAARRIMAGLAEHLHTSAVTPGSDIGGAIALTVSELDGAASSLRFQRKTMRSFGDVALESVANLSSGNRADFIDTGMVTLNRALGGWHRGQLIIIAGRPSMGKTGFVISSMLAAAKKGTTSLFFSMEMQSKPVSHRLLSDMVWNRQTPIPYDLMERNQVPEYAIPRLKDAAQRLGSLPMTVDDQRGLTVSEIGSRIKRHQDDLARKGKRLDVVCIDHLGKVAASSRYSGNKVHETGEKTNALATLASDTQTAIIVLQQLNRGVEGREEKRPGNADLRDSGNIEEDADCVMFLYRSSYYLARTKYDDLEKERGRLALLDMKKNLIEVIRSKQRQGEIGFDEFFVDLGSNAFRDKF